MPVLPLKQMCALFNQDVDFVGVTPRGTPIQKGPGEGACLVPLKNRILVLLEICDDHPARFQVYLS